MSELSELQAKLEKAEADWDKARADLTRACADWHKARADVRRIKAAIEAANGASDAN